ncbi:MAG: hypothetical protein A2V66_04750 [Ignavibacteria bacterium RBG_13_36_8]|nr:MAG: hypothetical protein A2V66_04750 [Ignavibacteria bacterium RBG_13_36_8]
MSSLETLKKYFGYASFRLGQEEIIDSINTGFNVLAILPTGAGKSLCYQIPALTGSSFSIVISPLIALMKDQVDALNKREQVAAFINSTLDYYEAEKVLNELSLGKIKILYASPEKLSSMQFAERIKSLNPSHLFVDEAHCISEWGHNFRPSYRKISEFCEYIGLKSISAFTATATPDVRDDIINQLKLKNLRLFVKGFERDNLRLNAIKTKHKKEKALELLSKYQPPAIIYTATRNNAEEISSFLNSHGFNIQYYHAGMTSELRRIIQDDFSKDRIKIIAATNAFGMGIDKKDIRLIIHYNMPGSIESYYQEIGRAGRDGEDSHIFLLYEERDRDIQDFFINNSFPTREQIEITYEALCNYAGVALGNIYEKDIPIDKNFLTLLGPKSINKSMLNSILTVLEEAGYIRKNSEFEKWHFVRIPLDKQQLYKYVKKIAADFLKDIILLLLREYGSKLFSNKIKIDIGHLSTILEAEPQSVIESLLELSNIGIIEYDKPLLTPSVVMAQTRFASKNMMLKMESLKEKELHTRAKLDQMVGYVNDNKCRMESILNYFGEATEDYKCGKCDICLGSSGLNIGAEDFLSEIILTSLHEARGKLKINHVINILLGSSKSPKLRKFSSFGVCIHFSKDEIKSAVESLLDKKIVCNYNQNLSITESGKYYFTKFTDKDIEIPHTTQNYEKELELFNLLRQARKDAALKFSQSVNLICSDEILREIARLKPSNYSELLSIEGSNQRLYNKIGDEILNIISEFKLNESEKKIISKKGLPKNLSEILELIKKGYGLKDISSLTKLPEAVVAVQVETLLEFLPDLNVDTLFDFSELDTINELINKGMNDIKELKKNLPTVMSYAKIRIALAKHRAK